MRFITQSTPYQKEDVWQHAVCATRLGQITIKSIDNKETVSLSDQVLKGCKANGVTNSTKKRSVS